MDFHGAVGGRSAQQADLGVVAAVVGGIGDEGVGEGSGAEAAEFPIQLSAVVAAGEQLSGLRAAAVVVGVIDLVDGCPGFGAEDRNDAIGDGHRAAAIGQGNIWAIGAAAGEIGEDGAGDEQQTEQA